METENLEGFKLMMNSWLLAKEDKQINKCPKNRMFWKWEGTQI